LNQLAQVAGAVQASTGWIRTKSQETRRQGMATEGRCIQAKVNGKALMVRATAVLWAQRGFAAKARRSVEQIERLDA
jgi:hypothetical protein